MHENTSPGVWHVLGTKSCGSEPCEGQEIFFSLSCSGFSLLEEKMVDMKNMYWGLSTLLHALNSTIGK